MTDDFKRLAADPEFAQQAREQSSKPSKLLALEEELSTLDRIEARYGEVAETTQARRIKILEEIEAIKKGEV